VVFLVINWFVVLFSKIQQKQLYLLHVDNASTKTNCIKQPRQTRMDKALISIWLMQEKIEWTLNKSESLHAQEWPRERAYDKTWGLDSDKISVT
jgi:hypothetical protein